MPIYQYRCKETGRVLEKVRAVEERDNCPPGFERVTVPVNLTVVGRCAINQSQKPYADMNQREQVIKGYRDKERRDGSRFRSKFSKQQIRKAWAI